MGRPTANAAERQLYREIKRAIAERRLQPGVKLTEDALATLFKVSRARVRKVLLLLAKDHIVRHEPNRGAFVWRPSVAEARQVLEARRLVESHLLRQATDKATPAQITRLRAHLDREDAARAANDIPGMMRLSGEFHTALADCSGNALLCEFLAGLISRCYLILATYQRRDVETCPQDDHKTIVAHVARGDADAAARALDQHFDHIEAELDLTDATDTTTPDLSQILRAPA